MIEIIIYPDNSYYKQEEIEVDGKKGFIGTFGDKFPDFMKYHLPYIRDTRSEKLKDKTIVIHSQGIKFILFYTNGNHRTNSNLIKRFKKNSCGN